VARALDERASEDLPGWGLGDCVEALEVADALVRCNSFGDVGEDARLVSAVPGVQRSRAVRRDRKHEVAERECMFAREPRRPLSEDVTVSPSAAASS
jgi:hypothetical protein